MSQLSDVENLLEKLSTEGELSSRGKFTLDPGRSRQKIAQYLQADGASWAYWWVRSMLALGATAGQIQLGRQVLLLAFPFSLPSPGFQAVQQFLQGGHDPADQPGIALLRSSLLWIQALLEIQPSLNFSLLMQAPQEPSHLWQIGVEEIKGGPISAPATAASLTLTIRGDNAAVRSLRADLAARLPARVAQATVPIDFEGRRLNPGQPEVDLLYARYYFGRADSQTLCVPSPNRLPAHHYQVHDQLFSRPRLSAPPSRVTTFSLAGHLPPHANWSAQDGQPLLHWSEAGQPRRLHLQAAPPFPLATLWPDDDRPWLVPLALFRQAQGADEFQIIDHGLALDSQPLPLHTTKSYGWKALVAYNGVQTDLSGLKPVHDQKIDSLVQWLRAEISEIHSTAPRTETRARGYAMLSAFEQ